MADASSTSNTTHGWPTGFYSPAAIPSSYRLESGDRLDRETFHERSEATPAGFRAELIRGTVIVPSPVLPDHSACHPLIVAWLTVYAAVTPGTAPHDNATVFLSDDTEVQPDGMLLILPEYGGRIRLQDRYFAGAPELVAEVSYSSEAYDLHSKLEAYEEAGVLEYVVVMLRERRIAWFVLQEGRFTPHLAIDGVFRSTVFPGLWLDEAGLLGLDSAKMLATLQQGLKDASHRAFVERLAQQRIKSS